MIKLLPMGARIRHKAYPELTGRILNFEFNHMGKLSPLPYRVVWDDILRARKLIGRMNEYQSIYSIVGE